MSRKPATYRQSDLDRAIRAVIKAGATSYDVVIEGARVMVRVTGKPGLSTGELETGAEIVL